LIIDSEAELPSGFATPSITKEPRSAKLWDARREYNDYDNISLEQKLTDEQALFCPSAIGCFDPQNLTSIVVAVTDLNPVKWNKLAFEQLVLDDSKKNIIRSMVENHSAEFLSSTEDIIQGKGAVGKYSNTLSLL